MAKYAGLVGYATQEETIPGVWENTIVEYFMRGDIVRANASSDLGDTIHDDLRMTNQLRLTGHPNAIAHYEDMLYVTINGRKWKVTSVELEHPRLIVTVGGKYNG